MAIPKGHSSGSTANGPRRATLRDQAAAHRASKGDRTTRAAAIAHKATARHDAHARKRFAVEKQLDSARAAHKAAEKAKLPNETARQGGKVKELHAGITHMRGRMASLSRRGHAVRQSAGL